MLLNFWYNLTFFFFIFIFFKSSWLLERNVSLISYQLFLFWGFLFLQKKPGCNQFIWISEVLQIPKGNLINKIKEIKSEQLNTFRVMLQFNVYNHRKH